MDKWEGGWSGVCDGLKGRLGFEEGVEGCVLCVREGIACGQLCFVKEV